MANILEHRKFVFVNAEGNNCKSWEVILYDNDDVEVKFGRIGSGLQSKVHHSLPGKPAGRKKMETLIRDKTRPSEHYHGGCYREIHVMDIATPTGSPSKAPVVAVKSELKQIAKTQIATCSLTQKLIEFFTEINAHDIYRATGGKITYDVSAGTFRTPLGIVVRDNVDQARKLLDDITNFINAANFSKKFITSLEDYLMLIPQDVGRKFDPVSFCGDIPGIQRQSQILDSLEASIDAVLNSSKKDGKKVNKDEQPKLFNVKLAVDENSSALDEIKKLFEKGRKRNHFSYDLKLKAAYAMDMPNAKIAWEKDGAKMQNIWRLWHGSKASNCLSILKSGFVVPPKSASHCCGRAFGDGIYHSAESTKSLNYATNYWGGRDEGRYFMFSNLVAMGNYFVPTHTFSGGCPKGYESTYCKAGQVFQNSEMIVYRSSQLLPTHLLEFGK